MDKVYIYCDESCQDSHNFMLLGGIAIKAELVPSFESAVAQIRQETNMHKELKWSRVTPQKQAEYQKFIDLFFDWNESGQLSFHCMILDNTKIDHRQFGGSYELGFYKFVYQLLLHCFGKRYGGSNDLHVFLDQRQTGYDMGEVRKILNNGMTARFKNDRRPFRLVEPVDSKKVSAIQINDLILGALGYRKNKRHLVAGTKQAKIDLSGYVMKRAGLKPDLKSTPLTQSQFTVWDFMLREKMK